MAQMNLSVEQKQTLGQREQTCDCREGGGRGMDGEFGVNRCKLLHLEWMGNGALLFSTGNYVQSLGIGHDGQ